LLGALEIARRARAFLEEGRELGAGVCHGAVACATEQIDAARLVLRDALAL
jgi:hypothetical protein